MGTDVAVLPYDAEIDELDITIWRQQDVVGLDVSVCDLALIVVQICHSRQGLVQDRLSDFGEAVVQVLGVYLVAVLGEVRIRGECRQYEKVGERDGDVGHPDVQGRGGRVPNVGQDFNYLPVISTEGVMSCYFLPMRTLVWEMVDKVLSSFMIL